MILGIIYSCEGQIEIIYLYNIYNINPITYKLNNPNTSLIPKVSLIFQAPFLEKRIKKQENSIFSYDN